MTKSTNKKKKKNEEEEEEGKKVCVCEKWAQKQVSERKK